VNPAPLWTSTNAAAATGGRTSGDWAAYGVSIDSRTVAANDLFVALKGPKFDGHDYVAEAMERGAVLAVIDRSLDLELPEVNVRRWSRLPDAWTVPVLLRVPDSLKALQTLATYWRHRHTPRVIGITGSVGKTTTKELTADVLSMRYSVLKSEQSYNNEIGLPLTLLNMTSEHERVVLEMGMYDVGEISELAEIALPHVGVVTIIGPVHLERAQTMERIVRAKTELVQALPPAPTGVAILNYDDPQVLGMRESTHARIFTYGLSPEADLWADEIEGLGLEGIRFRLHHGGPHP